MTDPTPLTVFYDSACGLCLEEIRFYRTLRGSDRVRFIDVNETTEPLVAPGLTRDNARRRLHVMRPTGQISSGGVALAHLWATLPALSGLGRFFLRKPWPCVLDAVYTVLLPVWPLVQRAMGAWARRRA